MNEKKELITAVVQYRSRANEKRVQAQAGIPMFYFFRIEPLIFAGQKWS